MTAPPPTPGRYLTLVYAWFGTEAARPKTPEWEIAQWTGEKWVSEKWVIDLRIDFQSVNAETSSFHWEIVKWQELPPA